MLAILIEFAVTVSSSYAETTKNDLTKIFEDVRDFLDLFPNEVVFVDFHDVPAGCQDLAAFNRLVMLSRQILGSYREVSQA